ncbi:MAG: hypothetical protein PF542_01905 [Nanoarchaeota archaeon]|jgi:parallel beta-helix repeat protein|nr:hypothetical protein [Nanoarchaeota archaeon]
MKNINQKLLIFCIVFILSLHFTFACYTPTGAVGIDFDENSGDNLTICTGDYSYGSSSTHIFELQGSNYVFDCNNSNFYGNLTGADIGTMFRITGHHITIKNCNINSFATGIEVYYNDNNIIIDNEFYSIKTIDISLNEASNNVIDNITSIGDLIDNVHKSIYLIRAHNNTISNLKLYNQRIGLSVVDSNDNNFENVLINVSSTGFQLQTGNNNYFNKFRICNNDYSGIFGDGVNFFGDDGQGNVLNNSNIYGNTLGIRIQNGNKLIINTNISGSTDGAISFRNGAINNTLYNLNISNNPGKGIYFYGYNSINNFIYNNYFSNNSQNIDLVYTENTPNYFNTTKTPGTNIIGGANIGGNYYDDYVGTDSDSDGIGNVSYDLGYGIYDFLPLTNNQSVVIVPSKDINVSFNSNSIDEGDFVEIEVNFSSFNNPTNISINFGDGNVSIYNSQSSPFYVNHTFIDDGSFDLNISVYDNVETISDLTSITVLNTAPFDLSFGQQMNQDSSYSFQPTFLDNGTDDSHTVFVFWGDGSNSSLFVDGSNAISHNYSSDGSYNINFSIIDDSDLSSSFLDFDVTLNDDEFEIFNNQTITLGTNASLELFIKYINSENINITWGDSTNTFDNNEANGSSYSHNYTAFGNYTVNATLVGCRAGGLCITANEYTATIWVSVIGYGDGIVNGVEACDITNFAGKSCSTYGHNTGSLTCNAGVIDSSACSTASTGGGGSSRTYNEVVDEINSTLINKTGLDKKNSSKFNNLIELINQTIPSLINVTIPIVENKSIIFDFTPFINPIFDFFEIDFIDEEYNFKPRLSLILNQYKNEINWNEEGEIYDFKKNISLIFNQWVQE